MSQKQGFSSMFLSFPEFNMVSKVFSKPCWFGRSTFSGVFLLADLSPGITITLGLSKLGYG